MADPSKTESATPRRKQEAREKGQIARSVEVNSALVLLAALLAFRFAGPYMVESIGRLWVFTYQNLGASFGPENIYSMSLFYMMEFVKIIAPILGTILVVGLIANYLQVGVLFTLKPLVPKFSNINPVSGFQKLFSRRSLVEFIKSLIKLALVGIIGYIGLKKSLAQLVPTMDMQGTEALKFVGQMTVTILDWIIFTYLGLALLDLLYQRWEYEENLKMTKQEVRDEMKQSEGDPMIKARIRQIQREMARRRMFDSVPKADVVVTNPTHVAVALQYHDGMSAPVVLAKGERVIAERIKEMARRHGVPIVENPPLARALLKQCPVGAPISPDLFGAVAEVLAFVYRLNQKKKTTHGPAVKNR